MVRHVRRAKLLSAMMKLFAVFVFAYEAMGDGEDGPTNTLVEQLIWLRAVTGLVSLRTGDAGRGCAAWQRAAWTRVIARPLSSWT